MKPLLALLLLTLLLSAASPLPVTKDYMAVVSYRPQGKAGLAAAWKKCTDPVVLNITSRGGWFTHWSPYWGCPDQTGFVPMWRPGDPWPQGAGYNGYALVFNECDRPDQDNCTPAQAAALWVQFKGLCPNCRAIALNISRCDNTAWYDQWREAVRTLTGSYPVVAGWGCHAYGTASQILAQLQVFKNWMVARGQTDKQLWLSEFGRHYVEGGPQFTTTEFQGLINALQYDPVVDRFAYFPPRWCNTGSCQNALFVGSSSTQLTPLGVIYRNGANAYP